MPRRKQVRSDVAEATPEGVRPLQVVLWSAASIAAGFIVYNVFLNQPPEAVRMAHRAHASAAAVDVAAVKGSQNTITLRYEPEVEELQRELLATGHYNGLVDGVNGTRTRLAIAAYQSQHGMSGPADVSPRLLEHIRFTRKVNDATQFTASTGQSPTSPQRPVNRISLVQRALADLGYGPGEATGAINAATRDAIRRFEADKRLLVDGLIDNAVLAELSKTTGYENLAKFRQD